MFDTFDTWGIGSIAGQGGWQGWNGNAAVAGTVTSARAYSGGQSLQLVQGNDTVRPFTGVTSGQWSLSLRQYIPSTSGGSTWTILMNQYPSNPNWSAQLLVDISQGLLGVFDGAGTQQGATLSVIKDQWVELRFDMNLSANSVSSYYNNTLIGSFPWQIGGINQFQALDLYPDEGATTGQTGAVYYDDVRLTLIPEPTTGAFLLLGGLAMLFRTRRPGSK
jgi:hypothetical protein